ncbi:hypothetical protein ACQR3P_03000 [Rhodococcus sp. IEGM1300]
MSLTWVFHVAIQVALIKCKEPEVKQSAVTSVGKGTIGAITVVEVGHTPTRFAMVVPSGCVSKLAIRIGTNLTCAGESCFCVGDEVQYHVITGAIGEPPQIHNLMKLGCSSE